MVHAQDFGFSEEFSFTTAPAPGSDVAVSLLAIADLGFCEGDGAMTWSGNYPNPIEVLPLGTPQEIRTEVIITPGRRLLHASSPSPSRKGVMCWHGR